MIVLDTNIFIHLAKGGLDASKLKNDDLAFASITNIEILGNSQITVGEESLLEALLDECEQIDLTDEVIQKAVKLRQRHRMTLGDSIVAATALVADAELWTANTDAFEHIEELRLVNPLV
jgi:predicted nucleic acid-binding protein